MNKDDPLIVYLRLSSAGYGTLDDIERWSSRRVIQALNWEEFKSNYDRAYREILKNGS